jgi:hypothetical protein
VTIRAISTAVQRPLFGGLGNWFVVSKFDPRVVALYSRHYSSSKNGKRACDWLKSGITSPGESMTLLTLDNCALWVWLKQHYVDSGQVGVNCAVFRNESSLLSSDLILEAEQLAWQRWPGERLYTYVNADAIRSANPGYCFKMAGWRKFGRSKGGLLILEKAL